MEIKLRAFTLQDLEDLYAFASLDVAQDAGWQVHQSLCDSADVILHVFNEVNQWAIELMDEAKVVGYIGISDDEVGCKYAQMVSFFIHPDYWNKGIATKALKQVLQITKFEVLYAYCFAYNLGSQKVLEKNGFIFCGICNQEIQQRKVYKYKIIKDCVYLHEKALTNVV